MKIKFLGIMALTVVLGGCATPDLPRGARLVGGGLDVSYTAPSDGTVVLRERTSGRIVATQSVAQGRAFQFYPDRQGCGEVLFSMFGSSDEVYTSDSFPRVPTNTFFELYFVPVTGRSK